ncbi:MAG: spore coat associated protein CotJA [bacterium]
MFGQPPKMELARAYVPFQQYTRLFEPLEGLEKGTIFPELFRPYVPHEEGSRGSDK